MRNHMIFENTRCKGEQRPLRIIPTYLGGRTIAFDGGKNWIAALDDRSSFGTLETLVLNLLRMFERQKNRIMKVIGFYTFWLEPNSPGIRVFWWLENTLITLENAELKQNWNDQRPAQRTAGRPTVRWSDRWDYGT